MLLVSGEIALCGRPELNISVRYGTLHLQATQILATILHRRGQRCFVGKCNMDRHSNQDYVEKGASESIADTKAFIKYVRTECCSPRDPTSPPASSSPPKTSNGIFGHRHHHQPTSSRYSHSNGESDGKQRRPSSNTGSSTSSSSSTASSTSSSTRLTLSSSLVQPILTPRFAISCTDTLMAGLQAMAGKDPSLHIQTHLAENPAEIEFTKKLFPFTDSYTQGKSLKGA